MSDITTYPVEDLRGVEPIRFRLGDQEFRVPRRTNTSVLLYLGRNAVRLESGDLVHDAAALRNAMSNLIASEVWDPEAPVLDDEGNPTYEPAEDGVDPEPLTGAWVPVDDRQRWWQLLDSERYEISAATLGRIVLDITQEITGHPTGASNS